MNLASSMAFSMVMGFSKVGEESPGGHMAATHPGLKRSSSADGKGRGRGGSPKHGTTLLPSYLEGGKAGMS